MAPKWVYFMLGKQPLELSETAARAMSGDSSGACLDGVGCDLKREIR